MAKRSRVVYLCSPKEAEGTLSLPMIKFSLIKDKIDFQDCDTLMFTSKQAVYYADKLDNSWKNYPVIAIGSATKKVVLELGGRVIYQPKNYYGKDLADGVLKYFKDRKILYIRPKVISFDSKGYLESRGVILKEEIIYETSCIAYRDKKLEKNAIIIFTSPSTIDCFFKSFKWDKSYLAVVIGNSTLKNLPDGVNAVVADEPTISSCIKRAKSV